MQSVTSAWLHDRGNLHDARVRDVRTVGSSVEIALDDEWASLRGLSEPEGQEAPGILVVEAYTTSEGEPAAANGGWISEVTIAGAELNIAFCDKPPVRFRDAVAWWRAE